MSLYLIIGAFATLAGLVVPAASRHPAVGIPGAATFTALAAVMVPVAGSYVSPLLGAMVAPVVVAGGVLLAANLRDWRAARARDRHDLAVDNITGGAR